MKKFGEMAPKVGGHGRMDFMIDWCQIDSLRNGLLLGDEVYDAALWSFIAPSSKYSVVNCSKIVDIPDFTCCVWKTIFPIEMMLKSVDTSGVYDGE